MKFTKMQGLGNDFMVIDGVRQTVNLSPERIRQWSDRHFGIGFDQLLLVEPARTPGVDFRYRIFNADGSEVEQCGNGARCFARFVLESGLTTATRITVETQKGIITPVIEPDGQVTVNMGPPRLRSEEIPFVADTGLSDSVLHSIEVAGHAITASVVSMGNPHVVVTVEDVNQAPVENLGPALENHARFPQRVNVGFMQIQDRHTIFLRVFERGCGETLACGTGACAAAVAGLRQGRLETPVTVHTRGGLLTIHWDPLSGVPGAPLAPVFMTGPAVTVFQGEIQP